MPWANDPDRLREIFTEATTHNLRSDYLNPIIIWNYKNTEYEMSNTRILKN